MKGKLQLDLFAYLNPLLVVRDDCSDQVVKIYSVIFSYTILSSYPGSVLNTGIREKNSNGGTPKARKAQDISRKAKITQNARQEMQIRD